jgi:hypothetical protein
MTIVRSEHVTDRIEGFSAPLDEPDDGIDDDGAQQHRRVDPVREHGRDDGGGQHRR